VQAKYDTLLAEDRPNHILLVTFSRPEVANAFNTRAAVELCDVFHRIGAEQRYRCVVLTGAGDRAFCAGADLKERNTLGDGEWRAQHETFERMFASVRDCPLPVLAAVNGAAYAGGLELVLLCDFAYASRLAKFALTEVSLGIMPGGGGTQTLARAVGERRAKELILAARPFSAEEALSWGIVNRICDAGKLLEETLETAARVATLAPLSVREAKRAIREGLHMELASAMRVEIDAYNRLVATEDRKEGIRAFNEKRKPSFKGR
jgi:enoyl-CoA hydratase/carnithine racemase